MANFEDYPQLKSLITDGGGVPFLGAKVSALAGCKTDPEIIHKFKEKAYLLPVIKQMERQKRNPREILGVVKQKISEEEGTPHGYESAMLEAFSTNHKELMGKFKPLIEKLLQLNSNLKLLTTNFDTSLKACDLFSYLDIYWKPEDFTYPNFTKPNPGVFHLHNLLTGGGVANLINEQNTYGQRYSDPGFNAFLYSIFQQYSIIFIGYGLRDKELLDILGGIKKYASRNIKEHYAIFSTETISKLPFSVREYFDLYNIRIINYGRRETFESALTTWLSSEPTISTGGDIGPLI